MEKFEKYTPEMAYHWLRNNRSIDSERDYLERIIATNATYSYKYAKIILKKPFPLGEEAIATDVNYSYWYAEDVLKNRFPLGEPIIATDALYSYLYAKHVLKKPFPLGEKAIFSSKYISDYIDFLIKTNQINESTIFDYDNSTKYFLGKFLDEKI